jgi:hypothetical protein
MVGVLSRTPFLMGTIMPILAEIIGGEQREICIHCGTPGQTSFYLDGVCSQCRWHGKPGREQLEVQRKRERITKAVALGILAFAFLCWILWLIL